MLLLLLTPTQEPSCVCLAYKPWEEEGRGTMTTADELEAHSPPRTPRARTAGGGVGLSR